MGGSRLELTHASDEMNKRLRALCQSKISHWAKLKPDERFHSETLSGGITNSLFRCWTDDGFIVVVRVFGENTESVICREAELEATRLLADKGFGKKILAEFPNGRIEEWISGRAITLEEMRRADVSNAIASRLATLHKQVLQTKMFNPGQARLWDTIQDWANKAAMVGFVPGSQKQLDVKSIDMPRRTKQLLLTKALLTLKHPSPIVFSHNDLLSGNIVINESEAAAEYIQFIDFEYASYNYRAFDIANHFCEICGFKCDWSQFPKQDFQLDFARAYLTTINAEEPSDQDAEALLREIRPWVLASHLFWGFWACIQAFTSTIDFNYLEYAKKRFEGFDYHCKALEIDLATSDPKKPPKN